MKCYCVCAFYSEFDAPINELAIQNDNLKTTLGQCQLIAIQMVEDEHAAASIKYNIARSYANAYTNTQIFPNSKVHIQKC